MLHGKDAEFYTELEERGKETPLRDLPKLEEGDRLYQFAFTAIRRLEGSITLSSVHEFCKLFPVTDKERLLSVLTEISAHERNTGN